MTSTHIQDEVQDEVILREENVRALHLEDNLPQADLLLGRHLLRHIHGWVILRLELDLDSLAIYIQCTLNIWRVRRACLQCTLYSCSHFFDADTTRIRGAPHFRPSETVWILFCPNK